MPSYRFTYGDTDFDFDLPEHVLFLVASPRRPSCQNGGNRDITESTVISPETRPETRKDNEVEGVLGYQQCMGMLNETVADCIDYPVKRGWYVAENVTGFYHRDDQTDDDIDVYFPETIRPATWREIRDYSDFHPLKDALYWLSARAQTDTVHKLVAGARARLRTYRTARAFRNALRVIPAQAVVLYGSRAAGTHREDSDYDLAVIVHDSDHTTDRRVDCHVRALKTLPRALGSDNLDMVVMTPQRWQAFRQKRVQHARVLAATPAGEMLVRTKAADVPAAMP